MSRVSGGVGYSTPKVVFANPATPATTASTVPVQAGLGVLFRPTATGKLLVDIGGVASTATATANVTVVGCYGTGSAPVNGAAATGTTFPQGSMTLTSPGLTGTTSVTFAASGLITGLTVGTPYWFDLRYATSAGADVATIAALTATVMECQ